MNGNHAPSARSGQPAVSVPLQITFRHMASSPVLETRIRELVGRLEKFSAQIVRCHVVIEPRPQHQRHGTPHDIRIDITLPDEQLSIHRAHPADLAHEDAYIALRDAFLAARRRLEEYERKRRSDVKRHRTKVRSSIQEPRRRGD